MDIPAQPFDGTTRPLVKPFQKRKSQARPLSAEYLARDLAERITAVVVTGLDGFLVGGDSSAWPGRLERIEKDVERLLVAEHVGTRSEGV